MYLHPLYAALEIMLNIKDHTIPDPGAPTIAPLAHRIKWSHVTKERATTILVALEGQVRIAEGYLDRVHLLGYPATPTDASIKLSELRSSDSGVYRCEVQHGIEDSHDITHVHVQGIQIGGKEVNHITLQLWEHPGKQGSTLANANTKCVLL